jgi:glycerol-3-phosphate dehydrogenase
MLNRVQMLNRLRGKVTPWDLIIIGGGATGVGCAVDAASRGYEVLLLEQSDFGKGTSSRSTKLVHGGVRYLEQGNLSLVMEALKERGILRRNAPHLVRELAFVVPSYDWWESPFYGFGLKFYDLLAGKYGFGKTRILSKAETLSRVPTIMQDGLRGGVLYFDGQFDDTRLLINLVATAADQGAVLINYVKVTGFTKDHEGIIDGVVAREVESGEQLFVKAIAVINATGPFCDSLRQLSTPAVTPLISPSQGTHLVLDRSFLPGDSAIMVPHTGDGRVMFAIPWHGHTLLGTTDTPIAEPSLEPTATEKEIDFILQTAGRYLNKTPTREDILSLFVGVRPLVNTGSGKNTASLSRDHTIKIDNSGLLTITGGKWTTYRHMAEDCINHAATLARLPDRTCLTAELKIHGYQDIQGSPPQLSIYGTDAERIEEIAVETGERGELLHSELPYREAEIRWAVRGEMARTVEDVLSRRTRSLLLNARAAIEIAPRVAKVMADELNQDNEWIDRQLAEFLDVAKRYLPGNGESRAQ